MGWECRSSLKKKKADIFCLKMLGIRPLCCIIKSPQTQRNAWWRAGALSKLLGFMRILNRDTSLYLSMSARFQNTWSDGETSITLRMCYLRRDKSAFETYLLATPRSNPIPTNAFFAGEGGAKEWQSAPCEECQVISRHCWKILLSQEKRSKNFNNTQNSGQVKPNDHYICEKRDVLLFDYEKDCRL